MLANSLLMRFSSSSRALAFLRSAMNCTRPRMFELLELDLPRKPAAVEDMVGGGFRCQSFASKLRRVTSSDFQ